MNNYLEKAILQTISWFDIFDYPLTEWEIWKWNLQLATDNKQIIFKEIKEVLEKSEEFKKLISYKQGFYFLKWQNQIVGKRKLRYLVAEKKQKKLIKIAQFLKLAPFVRVMAVATGLAYSNSKEEDDIDLFIITEKSKIWTARFFSVLILKFFRARPTIKNKKNKICLNFFIDQSAANLENVKLSEDDGSPDIYFIYWLAWLYPIFQQDDTWQKFISQNNWFKKYLPCYFPQQPAKRRLVCLDRISGLVKVILENIFLSNFWENLFRFWQMKIMPRQLRDLANKSSSVIINDSMLKFHDKDKRQEYLGKFKNKILNTKNTNAKIGQTN